MKTLLLFVAASLLFSLNLCSQDLKKLNNKEVDNSKIKIAQDFASNFLTKLKNGESYVFNSEAIDALKSSLNPENQKALYKQLKDQFGDYQKIEYAETWTVKNDPSITIYRFKSSFNKSNKSLEIRVVLNGLNKIAGFWIKPWSDVLN